MTKRRLENEIDEVSEAVLSDLTPDERLQLVLEAQAQGKDRWVERLVATCPRHRYRAIDRAFTERGRLALLVGRHALYDLHTTLLHYELVRLQHQFTTTLEFYSDGEPSEAVRDRVADLADQVNELFAELYTQYHAYRQFAEAVLGVDFETWVGRHVEGGLVLDVVEDALNDSLAVELAEDWLADEQEDENLERSDNVVADTDGKEGRMTLDELAEPRFKGLQEMWSEAIVEIEG